MLEPLQVRVLVLSFNITLVSTARTSIIKVTSKLLCDCSPLSPPDVCNSTDLPEFEIISLLEEQLPVYRLRADTVYGYDHDDWLHTPLVAPDARLDLTSEQIEETLKYFCKFVRRFPTKKVPSLM